MPTTSFYELYEQVQEARYFSRLAINPLAQFSSERGALLGAMLLPERLVSDNAFEETQIRYKIRPALDNNRYSPTQLQAGGQLIGGFKVDLGYTDTQSQLTPKEYDDLVKLLMAEGDTQALARLISWADNNLIRPHAIKNEIQRWQAWLLGEVTRVTVNGDMDPVSYYRPDSHVITVAGGTTGTPAGWHSATYDPFDDIDAACNILTDLGYEPTGLYTTPKLGRVLRNNEKVKERNAYTLVDPARSSAANVRLTMDTIQQIMLDELFPTLNLYNNGYESMEGYKRYMDVEDGYDYMMITGSTNRNWDLATDYAGTTTTDVSEFTDGALELGNVLGYYAIGKNAGEASPGRSVNEWMSDRKPKGMGGESYQTGLPVTQDPQSFVVLRIQQPT